MLLEPKKCSILRKQCERQDGARQCLSGAHWWTIMAGEPSLRTTSPASARDVDVIACQCECWWVASSRSGWAWEHEGLMMRKGEDYRECSCGPAGRL